VVMHFDFFFFAFSALLSLLGGAFLYQAFSDSSRDQFLVLVAGAVLVSLGLFCLFYEGRRFLRWLQESRAHHNGES